MTDTLNDDFSQPAIMAAGRMSWEATESGSVRRKRMEKDAAKPPRVTSVVEYAADSRFPGHRHPLGEEFLVLQGVFSDEHGHYPAGTYVRNPPDSSHVPFSDPGCIILVKLQQMDTEESDTTVVDALGPDDWQDTGDDDVATKALFENARERVSLYELQPGASVTFEPGHGILEIFVIEGSVDLLGQTHMPWTWVRQPVSEPVTLNSETSAMVYIKQWSPDSRNG